MKNARHEVMPSALVSQLIVLASTPLVQQASSALAPATQVALGGVL